MKPKLLIAANRDTIVDTMLNLRCDFGVCILYTPKARLVKIRGRPKK